MKSFLFVILCFSINASAKCEDCGNPGRIMQQPSTVTLQNYLSGQGLNPSNPLATTIKVNQCIGRRGAQIETTLEAIQSQQQSFELIHGNSGDLIFVFAGGSQAIIFCGPINLRY